MRKEELYSFTTTAKKRKLLTLYNTVSPACNVQRNWGACNVQRNWGRSYQSYGDGLGTEEGDRWFHLSSCHFGIEGQQEAWHALDSVTASMKKGKMTFTDSIDLFSLRWEPNIVEYVFV